VPDPWDCAWLRLRCECLLCLPASESVVPDTECGEASDPDDPDDPESLMAEEADSLPLPLPLLLPLPLPLLLPLLAAGRLPRR